VILPPRCSVFLTVAAQFCFFNMSHPPAIQIPLQFDGHNYREWAFCAQTVLVGYGLAAHLTFDFYNFKINITSVARLF